MILNGFGRVAETGRSLEFAFSMNDFSAAFAFTFSLLGHSAFHVLGQVDMLEFHQRDLDSPGIGLLVDRFLESFQGKGRMAGLLSQIPVKVILNPKAAILGAATHGLRR